MKIVKSLDELTDELTVVDFFATWCGPCKMLSPVLEGVCEEMNVELLKVDVDSARDLAMQYNISSVPTIYLFKNKKPIDIKVGYMDEDEVSEWLKKHQ